MEVSWNWELEFTRARESQGWARAVPELFAAELRRRRVAAGMSQRHVAVTMALIYGHQAWRQATVAQVEAGKRDLKLGEAAALASIVGTSLPELLAELEIPAVRLDARLPEAGLDGEPREEA